MTRDENQIPGEPGLQKDHNTFISFSDETLSSPRARQFITQSILHHLAQKSAVRYTDLSHGVAFWPRLRLVDVINASIIRAALSTGGTTLRVWKSLRQTSELQPRKLCVDLRAITGGVLRLRTEALWVCGWINFQVGFNEAEKLGPGVTTYSQRLALEKIGFVLIVSCSSDARVYGAAGYCNNEGIRRQISGGGGGVGERKRVIWLVSRCLEPSQPQRKREKLKDW